MLAAIAQTSFGEQVHVQHPVFEAPSNPDVSIWRYMDLAKFLSLLEDQALYFGRSDLMSDSFEGTTTARTLEVAREWLGTASEEFERQISEHRKSLRQHVYLSCWHMSEYESAAMWSLYQTAGHGIAVRSTYSRLSASMRAGSPIYIGVVRYVDFSTEVIDEGNVFYPFVHKRQSFEFEREIRAVAETAPELLADGSVRWGGDSAGPPGLLIEVDLNSLVEAIYIAPDAPTWFADLVRKLIERYRRGWNVRQSDLSADPIY
jgi:hypothetical protein